MDTTTLDFNTLTLLVAILGSTLGSTLTLVTMMYRRFDRLDTKFDTKIDALDTKFDKECKQVRREMADQGERLARIEGHLLGPESFSLRPPSPPPAEPDDDERQAS